MTYLIKRYSYPTSYFEDPSFFIFNYSKEEEKKQKEENQNLKDKIANPNELNENRYKIIKDHIKPTKKVINEFKDADFINLKEIYTNVGMCIYLAIHVETLHVLVKKVNKINQHEEDFCRNYSHRCMTPFYGFIKKNDEITGIVYEYMSNETLSKYMDKKQISVIEAFTIFSRICQAVNYLHSNHLIHRDIKPDNILFNHDNVPFLSDFDAIREDMDYEMTGVEMTADLGSMLFTSPEQDINEKVSYPTDIFPLGLIAYLLFENKILDQAITLKKKYIEFPPMTKGPKIIQNLYQSCVRLNQNERITIKDICGVLYNEAKEIDLFDNCNVEENAKEAIQYFYENVFLIFNEENSKIEEISERVIYWYSIFYIQYLKDKEDVSSFIYKFGILYEGTYGFKCDIQKAVKYFELAAKYGNSNALAALAISYLQGNGVKQDIAKGVSIIKSLTEQNDPEAYLLLGNMYFLGLGVEQNIPKGIECYESASNLNNSEALFKLGNFYFTGKFVKKDLNKARLLFEKAAELKNSDALLNLGGMWRDGDGVERNETKAIEYYEKSAEMNNERALYNLGAYYLEGKNGKKDYKKAREYFEKSAKHNFPQANNMLGRIYLLGTGVEKNYIKAREFFELSKDDSNSLYYLGLICLDGLGCEKDYHKAKYYFELSSKQGGDADAFLYLGSIYEYGLDVDKDISEAIKYYELAAKQKNSNAIFRLAEIYFGRNSFKKAREYLELIEKESQPIVMNLLGFIYQHGCEVKQDYIKAKGYFERAAKQNDSNGFLNLGNLYANGPADMRDYKKAKEYYELSKNLKNPEAFYQLGNLYMHGNGVTQDNEKAINYYKKAADLNCLHACLVLGNIYFEGEIVKTNYIEALKYFGKAAEKNNPEAFLNLGFMYCNGLGVVKSLEEGVRYYTLSAQQNNVVALDNLGICYLKGAGVEQNYKKAKYFFELAANQKYPSAINNLGNMYLNGDGVKQNYKKAIHYFEEAANLKSSDAMINLGIIYLNGMGVTKDYKKARDYFKLASDEQDSNGYLNLAEMYVGNFDFAKDYLLAKDYYEKAAELKNSYAYLRLGDLYFFGNYFPKNYEQAIKYYESAAALENSIAYIYLGLIYKDGIGTKKDIKKAINYLELAAYLKNPDAHLLLGYLYSEDNSEFDLEKAIDYFKIAAEKNNPGALYFMGYFHSTGEISGIDIEKAIYYYEKCANIEKTGPLYGYPSFCMTVYSYRNNNHRYLAYNNLGLIYLTDLNDNEKAQENLEKAAFGDLTLAQNNLGLFMQLYGNEEQYLKAEYYFKKSAKKRFALAEFNLGQKREKEGKMEESIKYYIDASDHQDEELRFHNIVINDKRLDLSIIFIICLTNLKLSRHFLLNSKYEEAKEYFIRAFAKINETYPFIFKFNLIDQKNMFSSLESMILNCPLFNLEQKDAFVKSNESFQKNEELIFNRPNDLFDFVIKNDRLSKCFIEEITKIIQIMQSILDKPPYLILFGRMMIKQDKPEKEEKNKALPINELFREGFGM